jgi:hypothetical protein
MGQRPGRSNQKPPKATTYAGLTTCLRCDEVFESWDRRQNRLCQKCREAIRVEPSDEQSYRLPKRKGRPRDGEDW